MGVKYYRSIVSDEDYHEGPPWRVVFRAVTNLTRLFSVYRSFQKLGGEMFVPHPLGPAETRRAPSRL